MKAFQKKLDKGEINIEKILEQEQDAEVENWSEGLDRNLHKIIIKQGQQYLKAELEEIAKQEGFTVEEIDSRNDPWIEDSSIRRADGKKYISLYAYGIDNIEDNEFINERNTKNAGGGLRVFSQGNAFDLEIENSEKYYATSYLEGGNVLNTLLSDGTPGAIIGESSIGYTLDVMQLENTPENIEKAKAQIAKDLGLKPENVTFIPQYDFHIDMLYHPLHNGEVAVPDFDEAINILKTNTFESMSDEEKNERIAALEKLRDETQLIRNEAEEKLANSGYKLIKLPCFTTNSSDETNFMNGVGGTSSKTNNVFYITNKSEYPELQSIIEKYLLERAGIDKVYFVDTIEFLSCMGGIDCLTQEE